MRIPYFLQGVLFGPIFIGLTLILKIICPVPAGDGCFADHLAIPIFLPLIFIYKVIDPGTVLAHELFFLTVYWSLVGLLFGLILDLRRGQSQYSPAPRPPL